MLDNGYDADDERGAVSNFKTHPVQQARAGPTDSNTMESSASPGSKVRRTHPQRSQNNQPTAKPSSGQQGLSSRKKRAQQHRGRVNGTGIHGAERDGRIKTQERRETLIKT